MWRSSKHPGAGSILFSPGWHITSCCHMTSAVCDKKIRAQWIQIAFIVLVWQARWLCLGFLLTVVCLCFPHLTVCSGFIVSVFLMCSAAVGIAANIAMFIITIANFPETQVTTSHHLCLLWWQCHHSLPAGSVPRRHSLLIWHCKMHCIGECKIGSGHKPHCACVKDLFHGIHSLHQHSHCSKWSCHVDQRPEFCKIQRFTIRIQSQCQLPMSHSQPQCMTVILLSTAHLTLGHLATEGKKWHGLVINCSIIVQSEPLTINFQWATTPTIQQHQQSTSLHCSCSI